MDDAFNEALPFHCFKAIRDLVLVRLEQWPATLEGDADLDG